VITEPRMLMSNVSFGIAASSQSLCPDNASDVPGFHSVASASEGCDAALWRPLPCCSIATCAFVASFQPSGRRM